MFWCDGKQRPEFDTEFARRNPKKKNKTIKIYQLIHVIPHVNYTFRGIDIMF